jgi:hypothetical protein
VPSLAKNKIILSYLYEGKTVGEVKKKKKKKKIPWMKEWKE